MVAGNTVEEGVANVTVAAGALGPGIAITSQEYTDVGTIKLDCVQHVLTLEFKTGKVPVEIDVSGNLVWTVEALGNVYTVTVASPEPT
jgi:hypothetical protein